MHKMLLLLSHELTVDQREDADASLTINEFVPLPPDLQELWRNIPPTKPLLSDYLEPFCVWIKENANSGDYVLIQGDFGAAYSMVNYAFSAGLIPVYATTERESVETPMPDGSVKLERIFKHRMFRGYEMSEEVDHE